MEFVNSMIELIGNTPLLKLNNLPTQANIYVKCEFLNPYSIKDRPVLSIITEAEKRGDLQPGDTIIESTSGNTGIALAAIASSKGYKCILVMSEIQSIERRKIMKALGAELILSDPNLGTAGARDEMFRILEEHPEYFYLGQHMNPNNPLAHYKNTAAEIWRQLDGKVDILIAGLGSGGTISGSGRYLKNKNPMIKIVGFEPEEAPYISKGVWHPHHLMGISPGFTPDVLDLDVIDEILLVSEEQAFQMCRELAKTEGLLVGITSGAAVDVALRVASLPENAGKNIVTFLYDSGQRYLSVEGLFNC